MTLSYLPAHFHLKFDSPARVDVPPLFVLRSMLGKHLRSMSCIARQNKCPECMYNKTCAYAFLFETILPAQNDVAPGRDRASHPFAFTDGSLRSGVAIDECDFAITLFGKAVEYLPYMYAAFVRAGNDGIFKCRAKFHVAGIEVDGKNILLDSEHLDVSIEPKIWRLDSAFEERQGQVLVELKTPLRFKRGGKYGPDFDAWAFMSCLFRRAKTLCSLYGSADGIPDYRPSEKLAISDKKLAWNDAVHYSVRQKKAMSLGGVVGTLKLSGTFSPFEQNLFDFARLFNGGKNTNFGLGQMDFWPKWV